MNIPNFIEEKLVDENGNLTEIWKQVFMQLISELQNNASNEGIRMPHNSTTDISTLESEQSIGYIVYDKDTDKFKACKKKIVGGVVTGEFKEINLL